jgi:hypothetical protein
VDWEKTNPNEPKQTQFPKGQEMSASVYFTTNYENNAALPLRQNKPNSKPIPQKPKNQRNLIVNKGLSKSALRSLPENKPNLKTDKIGKINAKRVLTRYYGNESAFRAHTAANRHTDNQEERDVGANCSLIENRTTIGS